MISIPTKAASMAATGPDAMAVATASTTTIAAEGGPGDMQTIGGPTGMGHQSKSSLAETPSSSASKEIRALHVGGNPMVPLDPKDARLTKNKSSDSNPSPFFSSSVAFTKVHSVSNTQDVIMGEPIRGDGGTHDVVGRPRNSMQQEAKLHEITQAEINGLKSENQSLKEELYMIKNQLKMKMSDNEAQQRVSEHEHFQNHLSHVQETSARSKIESDELHRAIEAMKVEHANIVKVYETDIAKLKYEVTDLGKTIVSLSGSHREQKERADKYQKEKDEIALKAVTSELALSQLKAEKNELSARLEQVLDGESNVNDAQTRLEEMQAKYERQLAHSQEVYRELEVKYLALKKAKEPSALSDSKNRNERALEADKTLVASDYSQVISKSKPLDAPTGKPRMPDMNPESERSRHTDRRSESTRGRTLARTFRERVAPYFKRSASRQRPKDTHTGAAEDVDEGSHEYGDHVGRTVPIQDRKDTTSSFTTPERERRSSPIPLPPTPQSIGKGAGSNLSGRTNTSFGTDDSGMTLIEGDSIRRPDGKRYHTPPALLVRTPSDKESNVFLDDDETRSRSRTRTMKGIFAGLSSRESSPSWRRKSLEPVSPTPKAKSPSRGQAKHHAMSDPPPRTSPLHADIATAPRRKGVTSPSPLPQTRKRKQDEIPRQDEYPDLPVGLTTWWIPPDDGRRKRNRQM